jgi:hypothetical protein
MVFELPHRFQMSMKRYRFNIQSDKGDQITVMPKREQGKIVGGK